jgi:hypothetical protein
VRQSLAVLTAVAATAAVALLSACSSGGSQGVTSALPGGGVSQSHHSRLSASGIAPKFVGLQHFRQANRHGVSPLGGKPYLYVNDVGNNAVDVLKNNTWAYITSITSSINGPDGNWVDRKGNVYVANYAGSYITEYKKTGALLYTYSASDAVGVTTDRKGNVYEADYNGNYVAEYPQGVNSPSATCYPGGYVEGVAVNKAGDVFVDWTNFSAGFITKYTGGLGSCSGTLLGATVGFPGGMVLDKHQNLVICDQYYGVDIIAPPYGSVTSTLATGFTDPFHVTVNKNNKFAFVADAGTGLVTVLKYPSGATVATLGSGNGISYAYGAVDGKNYNP